MPPRQNLLFIAGLIAGFFVLVFMLHVLPAAEAETHAAREARQELRRDLAAAKACPTGQAVVWLDDRSMTCRKELP